MKFGKKEVIELGKLTKEEISSKVNDLMKRASLDLKDIINNSISDVKKPCIIDFGQEEDLPFT
jgi:hypothetical protein